MPTLDVSEAFDPSFWDNIVVQRRIQTVDNFGRQGFTTAAMNAQAVVTAASPDDLARLPDYQTMYKAISIYSIFRLQGPAIDPSGKQTHPDLVVWHGSTYVVKLLEDYSGYGRGFIHAIAESVQPVDPPPMPEVIGRA